MNGSSNGLTIVWGSPNDNNPAATNTVSFYTGANGTGTLIGQVLASDLYSKFSGINNTQDPGYLISFLSHQKFGSVVFTTGSSDFEFAAGPGAVDLGHAGHRLRGPRAGCFCRKRVRDRLVRARLSHTNAEPTDRTVRASNQRPDAAPRLPDGGLFPFNEAPSSEGRGSAIQG